MKLKEIGPTKKKLHHFRKNRQREQKELEFFM
jgi:hypothetical protein